MAILNSNSLVVVPWDFSEFSRRALNQALDLADDASQIRVVHIASLPVMVGPGMLPDSINEDALSKDAEVEFRKSVSDDPRCAEIKFTTLVRDEYGHAICDFAADNAAELIVISSHGRSGLARLVMGSVAERVVRYAKCPVLVLRSAK